MKWLLTMIAIVGVIAAVMVNTFSLSAQPPENRVLVETDQQEYQRNQEIIVKITNDADTRITTFDQQAFCTIIRLEQEIGMEWQEVKNCISGVPIRLVTIESHKKVIVKLPGLTPGIYRVSIVFSLGETFHFDKSFVSSSKPFRVQ